MKLSSTLLIAAQALMALAAPAAERSDAAAQATSSATFTATTSAAITPTDLSTTTDVATTTAAATTTADNTATTTTSSAQPTTTVGTGNEEGEDKNENEVEQQGQFGRAIRLRGGNVKIDTLFPAGVNGVLEVEFQNNQARTLVVTENRNPAPPPQGFVALEPVSYRVRLRGGSARNLTLQKIDYIRNANSTIDISQGRIARFCNEANAFVFGEGELEFEADENELTLTVSNMVGEWAIFVPESATAGAGSGTGSTTQPAIDAGAGAGTGTGAGNIIADLFNGTCGAGTLCGELLDLLRRLTGQQ